MPSVSPAGQATGAKELPRRPNMKGTVGKQPKSTPAAVHDGNKKLVMNRLTSETIPQSDLGTTV